MNAPKRSLSRVAPVLAVLMFCWCPDTSLAAAYEVTDLGSLAGRSMQGFGVNAAGDVVGIAYGGADAVSRAFLYHQGVLTELTGINASPVTSGTEARAINDAGQVVGTSVGVDGFLHATTWINGVPVDLGTNGAQTSNAYGINNAGQIVGTTGTVGGGPRNPCVGSGSGTVWTALVPTPVLLDAARGDRVAELFAINDAGQIAGCLFTAAGTSSYTRAAVWPAADTVAVLAPGQCASGLANGSALALDAAGAPVGIACDNQAATWSSTDLVLLDGSLSGPFSAARAVGNGGQVVGNVFRDGASRATLWANTAATALDLNSTLRPEMAAVVGLEEATAINASGQIVANGGGHAYLLTPVAAAGPPTVLFTSDRTAVYVGETFSVTWSSTNAWACVAASSFPYDLNPELSWSGPVALNGSHGFNAGNFAGTIHLEVQCSFGTASASAPVAVTVSFRPATATLTATPGTIQAGGTLRLTWTATNVDSCSATGGGSGDGWSGGKPLNGSEQLIEPVKLAAASVTLNFILTCVSNTSGESVTARATVVERQPPQSSGGGTFDLTVLLVLAALRLAQAQRRRAIPVTLPGGDPRP